MFNFWCFVLFTVTLTGPYVGVSVEAQEGILPLNLSPGDDSQISPRRQRLIDLLTELVEKHVPLGVWTRDGALATSDNRDRNSWDSVESRNHIGVKTRKSDENENKVSRNRPSAKSDLNTRVRTPTSNSGPSRSNRRKIFIKMRKGEKIEAISDTNSRAAIERRIPLTYIPARPSEDEGYRYERFGPTLDQVTPSPTYPACTTTDRAMNLIQTWKREMKEKIRLHSSTVASPADDADYYDEIYSSTHRPETPQWDTSMMLRGQLSVPMAGYSENYTLWYDADSGESRLEINGGMMTALRLQTANGYYKLLGMQYTPQSDGQIRRVCRVANGIALSYAETAPTALPDMSQFTFQGYVESDESDSFSMGRSGKRVERWQLVKRQKVAASKTACEEELTYRHEVLIERGRDGAVPQRYSVEIDSSILGKISDTYVHTYQEIEMAVPSADKFDFDERAECEQYKKADVTDSEQYTTYFEPLQEFTSLSRGPLYTERALLERYKKRFSKKYKDRTEEVLRNGILMQKSRFVLAVNRRGETFLIAVNRLSDLTADEIQSQFLGAIPYQHGGNVAPSPNFPYEGSSLKKVAQSLPRNFDWRERGWVSTVYRQDPCNTCWAYAVTGAIEGGIFARTNRSLDLSEQSLIDCGHLTGANNCDPTWPIYAYEYARQYGLPESEEYGPTIAKRGDCKKDEAPPLAHISGHHNVTVDSVWALKVAIYQNGPVVILVDAMTEYFLPYTTGILYDPDCHKERELTNHAVLAVGWGQDPSKKTYFIIKNSWGSDWGENGYMKLGGRNACGMLTAPSYPLYPREVA